MDEDGCGSGDLVATVVFVLEVVSIRAPLSGGLSLTNSYPSHFLPVEVQRLPDYMSAGLAHGESGPDIHEGFVSSHLILRIYCGDVSVACVKHSLYDITGETLSRIGRCLGYGQRGSLWIHTLQVMQPVRTFGLLALFLL
jgi:hypothetical protein